MAVILPCEAVHRLATDIDWAVLSEILAPCKKCNPNILQMGVAMQIPSQFKELHLKPTAPCMMKEQGIDLRRCNEFDGNSPCGGTTALDILLLTIKYLEHETNTTSVTLLAMTVRCQHMGTITMNIRADWTRDYLMKGGRGG